MHTIKICIEFIFRLMILLIPKLQHRFTWIDYFPPITTIPQGQYNSRQQPSDSNVFIFNCLFNAITSSSNGGALCCESATRMLVESCSFFSCKTSTENGGAIYFSNTNTGECVLEKVCGNDCWLTYAGYSNSRGQFARIDVRDTTSNKNYVNYSSIARCVSVDYYSRHTLRLKGGMACCMSVNMSMNKCDIASAVFYEHDYDSGSVTCSLSYSSFADNISPKICICFDEYNAVKSEIKCCNILRNTHTSYSGGLIYTIGNMMIQDSCIIENSADYIFYQKSSSYTITLSNCTVDSTSNNGYLTIKNTVTKSFILGLNHMSTRNCNAEYDSAGKLTVIPYVSQPTKKVFCYTYKKPINHNYSKFLILN
jgi:hypothetical protein